MIRIFVHADDSKGKPLVADHFDFEAVPRVGEELVVDQDDKQFLLTVKGVTHHAFTKGDFPNAVSKVLLACDVVHEIALKK